MKKQILIVSNPDRGGWDAKRPNAERAPRRFEKNKMHWTGSES